MRIRDELAQLVEDQPGATAGELFSLLPPDLQPSGKKAAERHLRLMAGRVHERDGGWHPGPVPAPQPEPDRRPSLDQVSRTAQTDGPDIVRLDADLRERLRGRRLVAEARLTRPLFDELTDAVQGALTRLGLESAAHTYPHAFMSFLVGHGVYGYERGKYWGIKPLSRIDRIEAGSAFEQLCKRHNLEDFSDVLGAEGAHRYLTPILAHGGIPEYSLDDFFRLVLHGLRHIGEGSGDLLSYWRTRRSAFNGVDAPVRRFLLYGGAVSTDFLDRVIDAIHATRQRARPPTPEESGLPPYVLDWLARDRDEVHRAKLTGRHHKGATANGQPRLLLDPYSPLGPEVVLPLVASTDRPGDALSWRLSSAEGVVRRPVSAFEEETLSLTPQKAWSVELLENDSSSRAWRFEGFDESPALLFDPETGEVVVPTAAIGLESVWMVATPTAEVQAGANRPSTGAEASPRVIEGPVPFSGDWTGYGARLIDLSGCSQLRISDGGRTALLTVRPVGSRPHLQGDRLEGVTTSDGRAVYAEPPTIVLPEGTGLTPDQWLVKCQVGDGEPRRLPVNDNLRCPLDLPAGHLAGQVAVSVQGTLGSDLRHQFAVVPGLRVRRPEQILLPHLGGRAEVSLHAPGCTIDNSPSDRALVPVPEAEAAVLFTVSDGATALALRTQVPKLLWAKVERDGVQRYSAQALTASIDAVASGELHALAVRLGQADHPLQLHLTIDHHTVQVSDKARSGLGDGRWTFDLAPFRDILRTTDAASAQFVLKVGEVPVTLLHLRAEVDIQGLTVVSRVAGDFVSARAQFTSSRRQRDRAFRLWSMTRPWEPPAEARVPDGSTETEIQGYGTPAPGQYIAEIVVDDDWARPARPSTQAANAQVVRIGTPDDELQALTALDPSDPWVVLESAIATGRLPRHLEPDELEEVASGAMAAVRAYYLAPDPNLQIPRGAGRALRILALRSDVLARAVNTQAEQGRLDRPAATRLALRILWRPYEPHATTQLTDDALRRLWAAAPAVAALVDMEPPTVPARPTQPHTEQERADRLGDMLGWSPAAGPSKLFTGEPVDQRFAGADADQLKAMLPHLDLLPKALLAQDALVDVNFAWLIRARDSQIDLKGFWSHWRHQVAQDIATEALAPHLEKRTAPEGTEPWASIPKLTLNAASWVTSPEENETRGRAVNLLDEAMTFAPRLVERDLVLARALHMSTPRPHRAPQPLKDLT